MNKRAEIVTDNTVEGILAIGAVIVLIGVFAALFFSGYDEVELTAESYLDNLKKTIDSAETDRPLTFIMLNGEEDLGLLDKKNEVKSVDFYLVYFGDSFYCKETSGLEFVRLTKGKDSICICYSDEDKNTRCKECLELGSLAIYSQESYFSGDFFWLGVEAGKCSIKEDFRMKAVKFSDGYMFYLF
jgi:hypothetical protein